MYENSRIRRQKRSAAGYAERAAKRAAKARDMALGTLQACTITEVKLDHSHHHTKKVSTDSHSAKDDLLAFQSSHFGDDTKPDNWFVDAETALNFEPAYEEQDALGYYDDGTKRTLTDEQITMFRRSEIEELLRERRLQRDEEDYQNRDPDEDIQQRAMSPASDVSSLEGDLLGLARPAPAQKPEPKPKTKPKQSQPAKRQPSRSGRSDTSRSTGSLQRQRRQEVPYDERHKRKWEDYIDENDPVHGSMTHRRMVRMLDEQQEETPEIDYG